MSEKDSSQQPVDIVQVAESNNGDGGNTQKENGTLKYYFRVFGQFSDTLDVVLRIVGCAAAFAAGVAPPLMTLVFGSSVDQFNNYGAGGTSSEELYRSICHNALWFLYLFIARLLLVYIHSTCFGISAVRTNGRFRQAFVRSLISQDVAYLDSCSPGTVAATITNNADTVENGIGEKIGSLLQATAMFIAAFVVAFSRMWDLTLVTATIMPVLLGGFIITFGLDAKVESKIMEIYNTAGGLVEEALSTVRIVTAFDANLKLSEKYDTYLAKAQSLGFKKGPILGVQYSVEFFSTFCGYSLAWYYGIKVLNRDHINDGGQVVTVLLAVLLGTTAVSTISFSFGDVTMASVAAKGMFEMIDRKSQIDPLNEDGRRPEKSHLNVELKNVTFAYPSRPDMKVLDDVSLTFEEGKVTALVGPSGSGKSTIVGLIERWFDTAAGSVEVGGAPVKELNLRWLRSQIGLVQQEPFLFDDTIYANVAHGLYGSNLESLPEEKKRELVREACVQAFVNDFILELPNKYDTRVGERGGFLSGGQKQRIAIARSIVSNPRILLLDEATSALDPTAEKQVQAALENVSKSRTTIMIAHKLSTVRNADKIVVLNSGRVIEEGNHNQLIAKKGAYFELVNAQSLEIDQGHKDSKDDIHEIDFMRDETSDGLEKISSEKSQTQADAITLSTEEEDSEDKELPRKFSLARCLYIIIFKEQRRLLPLFLGGFLASTCGGGLFPGQAVLFGHSIVTFQIPPSPEFVSKGDYWALMYFIFALCVLVSYLGVGFFWTMAAFHATRFYRREYFDSMLRQDIAFFDMKGHGSAELTGRLALHAAHLQGLLSTNLAMIMIVIVTILSCCILSLVVGWQLGLVVIVGCMPLLFGAGFARMRLEMANHDKLTANYLDCARFAAEAVGAIRTVSSLTIEGKILSGYQERLNACTHQMVRAKLVSMFLFALSESLDLAAAGLAFWYGGKLLSQGKYNVTTFFTVYIGVLMGSQAAGNLFGFTSNTTRAQSAANHIIHLRRSQPPINTSTGVKDLQPIKETENLIQFNDVCFSYPSRRNLPVLKNLKISIKRGESVGIVGGSGCGKSTLIALLERFYDIEFGQILIHNTPIDQIDVRYHRSRIGLVSQDTTLYHGSIRDNIIIGLSDMELQSMSAADIERRVIDACKLASIHEFITSLPESYNTDIGNRGVSLSGGQRQRLAIARAMIREPEILIFDEATSALDTANEALVQASIEAISKENAGCTTISVAHRLSTIKRCDKIFVLHRGQVVETGTHQELIKLQGRYYEMALSQALDQAIEMS